MKICMLANAESVHTRRWVSALSESGIGIVLISMGSIDRDYYGTLKHVTCYTMHHNDGLSRRDNKLGKLKYLGSVRKIRKIIRTEKPDILHAHYASSYGLIGALCRFHPYIISVWGSDVYEFPRSSFIARWLLKYSLSKADRILSTSHAMASETQQYCKQSIEVTPFGVDTDVFQKRPGNKVFAEGSLVIGTIKSLENVYGIDLLIRAFALVKSKLSDADLKLLIVGSGSRGQEYKDLADELALTGHVLFSGFIEHAVVSGYYNAIDIFVVPSRNESFGVSVLEASACEKPVIATRVGGLPEVVADGETGIIVEPDDPPAIANALELLIKDPVLRDTMGRNGRKRTLERYQWKKNVETMQHVYSRLLAEHEPKNKQS